MQNNKNLTFSDLGFHDFIPILVPRQPENAYKYTTMTMPKDVIAIRDFMIRVLAQYMNSSGKTEFEGEFFAGAAYMLDGSVFTVFNGMDADSGKLFAKAFAPDAYTQAQAPEDVVLESNIDYLNHFFNARTPKGLALIQEIPSPDEETYHFRIVHSSELDSRPIKPVGTIQ